ncbi:hypothetical protein JW766_06455 [Candidatus Dojkabacteria bacterium]|nr:hypothetical protein [Candidatus Dojkabacteria bacterium]
MCGIFGVIPSKKGYYSSKKLTSIIDTLLRLSESRGKDASGVALASAKDILVYKRPISASSLIKSKGYKDLINSNIDEIEAVIGHARMETNGSFSVSYNNQPVVNQGCITIHNGIVVNVDQLWEEFHSLERQYTVDTEIINALLRKFIKEDKDILNAVRKTFSFIEGSFATGTLFDDLDHLLLATNTGSLFLIQHKASGIHIFTSEEFFARALIKKEFGDSSYDFSITKIQPGSGLIINLSDNSHLPFSLDGGVKNNKEFVVVRKKRRIRVLDPKGANILHLSSIINKNEKDKEEVEKIITEEFTRNQPRIEELTRCVRCLLPETMPFIHFDDDGVCNYCHNYQKRDVRGQKALHEEITKFKNKGDDVPNCIVSFSGGRDSSYALHYAKNELGLNPLAFSYDWGMLTDLGRRNQARMTGKLGVEHILVSADIQKKREYIRKNVSAWLKKPHIGMVPLFMAGDKQYFYYLNKVRGETGIDLVIYADNSLEKTDFKYGFANVYLTPEVQKAYAIGITNTFRLLWFYASHYLSNPSYLNASLIDTFTAYISSYFVPKEYVYLYRFIPWNEKVIEKTLLEEYNWELSPDTKTSWRIGDGTASFYNYIYYTVTGFTENDTFRSNQIREGLITREDGYRLSKLENKPRLDSILWYCNTIEIDMKSAIQKINSIKKLF